MMQFRNSLFAIGVLGLIAGCSQPAVEPAAPGPVASNSKAAQPAPSAATAPTAQSKATNAKSPSPSQPAKAQPLVTTPNVGAPTSSAPSPTPEKSAAPNPAPVKNTGWVPTKKSPLEVGSEVDSMIKGLSGVQVEISYAMTIATGQAQGQLVEKIRSPKVYDLEFPVLVNDPRHGIVPNLAHVKADGKTSITQLNDKMVSRDVSAPKPPPAPLDLVQNWAKSANREVFAGIIDQRNPFSEYVRGLLDKKSGYSVNVKERHVPFQGKVLDQYLISAERNKQAAKTLGASTVYIIVDANIHLPVLIEADLRKPNAMLPDSLKWSAKWINHKTFPDTEFKFPGNPT